MELKDIDINKIIEDTYYRLQAHLEDKSKMRPLSYFIEKYKNFIEDRRIEYFTEDMLYEYDGDPNKALRQWLYGNEEEWAIYDTVEVWSIDNYNILRSNVTDEYKLDIIDDEFPLQIYFSIYYKITN